jgi:hypothetical protein
LVDGGDAQFFCDGAAGYGATALREACAGVVAVYVGEGYGQEARAGEAETGGAGDRAANFGGEGLSGAGEASDGAVGVVEAGGDFEWVLVLAWCESWVASLLYLDVLGRLAVAYCGFGDVWELLEVKGYGFWDPWRWNGGSIGECEKSHGSGEGSYSGIVRGTYYAVAALGSQGEIVNTAELWSIFERRGICAIDKSPSERYLRSAVNVDR